MLAYNHLELWHGDARLVNLPGRCVILDISSPSYDPLTSLSQILELPQKSKLRSTLMDDTDPLRLLGTI